MENIIIKPFELSYTNEVLLLLFESFKSKFTHIISISEDKIKNLFEDIFFLNNEIKRDGHFVALCDGAVVGVILLEYKKQERYEETRFPIIKLSDLFLKYGFLTTIRFIFALNLLSSNKIAEHECYIEHVAISKDFRGFGIGSQLISYAETFISELPFITEFSLHVAQSNAKALKLYEKLGFVNKDRKKKKAFFLKTLIGEEYFYYMDKKINGLSNRN